MWGHNDNGIVRAEEEVGLGAASAGSLLHPIGSSDPVIRSGHRDVVLGWGLGEGRSEVRAPAIGQGFRKEQVERD